MLVHEFLEKNAEQFPDQCGLICAEKKFTYRQINEMANQLAHALIAAGLKRGDRVSVFMDNTPEAVFSIYGILKAGGIFTTLSPTLKARKLEFILKNSDAGFLITHRQKMGVVSEAINNNIFLKSVISCGIPGEGPENAAPGVKQWETFIDGQPTHNPDNNAIGTIDIDLANIIYTSGSTSEPKGVMMTHLNMISAASSIIQYLGNRKTDITLNVLPLSFDYGLYQLIMTFMFGGTLVLEESFAYPGPIIEKLIKERVSVFPGVPTIFAILLQLNLRDSDFTYLRCFTNTAAALPVQHIKLLRKRFPQVKIYSMYGLTECKRVSYLPPDMIEKKPESVGKGMPNQEVYIVDENGEKVGPGVIGELVVRGSHVMKGYWKAPRETKKRLKPGPYPGEKVLYTGDLFRMDEDGYLYFVARKDDIIKTRGERVSPKEIEEVLYEIDGVREAAVIGVPDDILGNSIKAFIVPAKGKDITKERVLRYCKQNLEYFMVPKEVEFVDSFKKTTSGKIDKKALK
jgi:long-chain acyl-CoA synthetase